MIPPTLTCGYLVIGCQMVVKISVVDNALSTGGATSHTVQVYTVVVGKAQSVLEAESLFLVESLSVVEVCTKVPVAIDIDGLGGSASAGLVIDHTGGYSVISTTVPETGTNGPYLGPSYKDEVTAEIQRMCLVQVRV